jgi:hypothetical protein
MNKFELELARFDQMVQKKYKKIDKKMEKYN